MSSSRSSSQNTTTTNTSVAGDTTVSRPVAAQDQGTAISIERGGSVTLADPGAFSIGRAALEATTSFGVAALNTVATSAAEQQAVNQEALQKAAQLASGDVTGAQKWIPYAVIGAAIVLALFVWKRGVK
jgi:hypothetical protein